MGNGRNQSVTSYINSDEAVDLRKTSDELAETPFANGAPPDLMRVRTRGPNSGRVLRKAAIRKPIEVQCQYEVGDYIS